jgi:hypothetical protein
MKSIKVNKIGSILIGEDSAKELFIMMLEAFMEGERDDDIELDFSSVLTIDPAFFSSLVLLCTESNQFDLDRLSSQVIFSGLYIKDIEHFNYALIPIRQKKQYDPEELKKLLREMHEKRQKEIWGDNPIIRNAFEKVAGAIENAFANVPDVQGKK